MDGFGEKVMPQEIAIPSDIFLSMEPFDLMRKTSFTKRICKNVPSAVKRITWIENHTTDLLDMPIYETEFKLKAVLASGLIPIDVIGEANKAMSELYNLLLKNQKEGLFD